MPDTEADRAGQARDRAGRLYFVRLTFDDMHDTGIYGWDYLRELGRDGEAKFQTYLDDLAEKGLSRERGRRG